MTSKFACAMALALGLSSAAVAADRVTCSDGTTSTAGRGACRGHGGVARKATKKEHESLSAKTKRTWQDKVARKPKTEERREAVGARARETERRAQARTPVAPERRSSATSRGSDNDDPTGAIARCRDGTYSHARSHSGACSSHGGVGDWMDRSR